MIETAGKNREENIERFWSGMAFQRASKACISKQLKNLVTSLFVNASKLYFSDVKFSVQFVELMFCDVKKKTVTKKKGADEDHDEELTFKNRSVFDVVNILSFLSCEFEEGVFEWISKKFRAIHTILFSKCHMKNYPSSFLPISQLNHLLHEKKCKFYEKLRFLLIDSFERDPVSVNLERYKSDEEKAFIGKYLELSTELMASGISINDGDQTLYLHDAIHEQKKLDLCAALRIIPEQLVVVCIMAGKQHVQTYHFYNRLDWIYSKTDLELFGAIDHTFPFSLVLGIDDHKLAEKKTLRDLIDFFRIGFNFWSNNSNLIENILWVIVYYYQDEEIVQYLKNNGLNIDLEGIVENDGLNVSNHYITRRSAISQLFNMAGNIHIMTNSLKKYFDKNGADFVQNLTKDNFLYVSNWNLNDERCEFIEYLSNKCILGTRYLTLVNDYREYQSRKLDTGLEPKLKKMKGE